MAVKQRIQSWLGGGSSVDKEAIPKVASAIPCGICERKFSTANLDKLFAHLGGHFDMRHHLNRCHECRINFVTQADLSRHLQSAKEKLNCGFMFEHREPCKGHHPQHHGGSNDDHRFDFCYRLQGWEYAQLRNQRPELEEQNERRHRKPSTQSRSFTDSIKLHLRKSSLTSTTSISSPKDSKLSIDPQPLLNAHLLHLIPTASLPLLTSLLSAGAVPTSITDSLGFTPMHYAAQYGTPETASLLLQNGASLSTPDRNGSTPLSHAIRTRNVDLVRCFLARGSVPVTRRDIEASVDAGDVHVARAVLEYRKRNPRGVDGGEEEGEEERSDLDGLLIGAVRRSDEGMVRLLLENGARVDGEGEREGLVQGSQ